MEFSYCSHWCWCFVFAQTACLKSSHAFHITLHTNTQTHNTPVLMSSPALEFLSVPPYITSLLSLRQVIIKLYVLLCVCVPLYIYPCLSSCLCACHPASNFYINLWSDAAASFFICICFCQFCASQMFLCQTRSLVSTVTTWQTVYNMLVLCDTPLRLLESHHKAPAAASSALPHSTYPLCEPTKRWVQAFGVVCWCN